jgi:hypothetical protein
MSKKLHDEYNKDFYAWTIHNVMLMRQGKLSEIDVENVAEELESMGNNNKRELVNRLAVLIAHLLKWQCQPIRRSKSWILTIKNQRFEILDLLEESPSLKHQIELKFNHAYEKAKIICSEQTGIDEDELPANCPFSLEECLNFDFLPG